MKFPLNFFYTWFRNTLRNPKYRWWIIIGSIIYLFSPIDISPDFIPIIGQLDDITILGLLIGEISQLLFERLQAGKGHRSSSPAPDQSSPAIEVESQTVK